MKLRTIRWAQVSPRLPLLMHTVCAARGRGKRPAGQLFKSPHSPFCLVPRQKRASGLTDD